MAWALGVLVPLQLVILVEAQSLTAQVEAGSRVRVTTVPASPGRRIGTLVSLDRDTLRWSRWDTTSVIAVPVASVARLERSTGRRSNTGRGAMIGGLIGAGFGLFVGIAAATDNSGFLQVGVDDIAAVTGIGGAAGAGVGAIIGSLSRRDRWEPVSLTPRVGANLRRSRTISRLTIRF
jgi:hypothetical protein